MYRVLLVDDEPYITQGLTDLLDWSEYNMEVYATASSAAEALEHAPHVDLMITDIRMPEHDGLWLIRSVRSAENHMPVLVLSAYDDFDLVKQCFPLRIQNYLLKPVDEAELRSSLESVQEKLDAGTMGNASSASEEVLETTLVRHVHGSIAESAFLERMHLLLPQALNQRWIATVWFGGTDGMTLPGVTGGTGVLGLPDDRAGVISVDDYDGRRYVLYAADDEQAVMDELRRAVDAVPSVVCLYRREPISLLLLPEIHRRADAVAPAIFSVDGGTLMELDALEPVVRRARSIALPGSDTLRQPLVDGDHPAFSSACRNVVSAIRGAGVMPPHVLALSLYGLFQELSTLPGCPPAVEIAREVHDHPHRWQTILEAALREVWRARSGGEDAIHPVVGEMLRMIDDEIADDLSLKRLSYRFGMNATYLGQLFKQVTGEYYTNYLNKRRINRAGVLLKETTLKSCDIAGRVGVPDPNYFYRLFKRLMGLSPAEYRRRVAASDDGDGRRR